jgi:hypothetical protein
VLQQSADMVKPADRYMVDTVKEEMDKVEAPLIRPKVLEVGGGERWGRRSGGGGSRREGHLREGLERRGGGCGG